MSIECRTCKSIKTVPGRQGERAGLPTASKSISGPFDCTNPAASCSAPPPRRTVTAAEPRQLPEDHPGPLPPLHHPATQHEPHLSERVTDDCAAMWRQGPRLSCQVSRQKTQASHAVAAWQTHQLQLSHCPWMHAAAPTEMGPSPKDAIVRRSAPVHASAARAYRSAPLHDGASTGLCQWLGPPVP